MKLLFFILFGAVAIAAHAQQDAATIEARKQMQATSAALSQAARDEAASFFKVAFDLYQGGEFDAAVATFTRGLKIDPANALANFYLAESYRAAKKAKEARPYYENAVAFAPGTKEAFIAEARLAEKVEEAPPVAAAPKPKLDLRANPALLDGKWCLSAPSGTGVAVYTGSTWVATMGGTTTNGTLTITGEREWKENFTHWFRKFEDKMLLIDENTAKIVEWNGGPPLESLSMTRCP